MQSHICSLAAKNNTYKDTRRVPGLPGLCAPMTISITGQFLRGQESGLTSHCVTPVISWPGFASDWPGKERSCDMNTGGGGD